MKIKHGEEGPCNCAAGLTPIVSPSLSIFNHQRRCEPHICATVASLDYRCWLELNAVGSNLTLTMGAVSRRSVQCPMLGLCRFASPMAPLGCGQCLMEMVLEDD